MLFIFLMSMSCAHVSATQSLETTSVASNHVVKVCDGIYRGPRLADLGELASLRVHTILNLENNNEAVVQEEGAARELGIEVIRIPMSEITRPNPADLKKAVEIMEDPKRWPVYVHCLHGKDRTGLVVAAYKILHDGWTVERAYKEAIDSGHSWWLYGVILKWKKSLRELLDRRDVTRAPSEGRLSAPALGTHDGYFAQIIAHSALIV